jgi:hypothetical protein
VRSRIDKKHAGLLIVFDRLRRKRNTALYDDTGFVSRHDAEQALDPRAIIRGGRFLKADSKTYAVPLLRCVRDFLLWPPGLDRLMLPPVADEHARREPLSTGK